MSKRRPINPNAQKALNEMKYEIAKELGVINSVNPVTPNKHSDLLTSGQNVFFAGNVGGQMTKRLIEMGEKQLINKS
ncbi:MAG: alpha/beta-type small acid-soluble spore protein [Firmicutes bacterium]|nr:alpha/beta-type small acid-soluble spore protein [Bacillota bacterium]MTI68949.1 alpha/beta-type small acid-soluble spore protein [Bacillota bacterium]